MHILSVRRRAEAIHGLRDGAAVLAPSSSAYFLAGASPADFLAVPDWLRAPAQAAVAFPVHADCPSDAALPSAGPGVAAGLSESRARDRSRGAPVVDATEPGPHDARHLVYA